MSYDPFDFAQDRFTIYFSVCSVPSVAMVRCSSFVSRISSLESAFSAFIRGSISGFNDDFVGSAPDLGAFERGGAPIRFGRRADPDFQAAPWE